MVRRGSYQLLDIVMTYFPEGGRLLIIVMFPYLL